MMAMAPGEAGSVNAHAGRAVEGRTHGSASLLLDVVDVSAGLFVDQSERLSHESGDGLLIFGRGDHG